MSRLAAKIAETFRRIRERGDDGVWISLEPEDQAFKRAKELESDPAELPLKGRTFAIKDNIDLAGLPTTAACPDFAYTPAKSAFVVQRLIDAGAIPIGKTNLDQFATGSERHTFALRLSVQFLQFSLYKRRIEFGLGDCRGGRAGGFCFGNGHCRFRPRARGFQ